MLKFLLDDKKGRFFLVGTILLIFGIILDQTGVEISKFVYYASLIFLGFYPAINAFKATFIERDPNDALLMILAAIGAVLINYESEGAILLFIYSGAEVLEEYVSGKSSNAIKELMEHIPDEAKVVQSDGSVKLVPTDELKIGDIVSVAKGDNIPIDGIVDREILVNESALTGESVPVLKKKGDLALTGTINEGEAFTLTVTKLKKDTVFSNIIKLVEEAQSEPSKKGKMMEQFEKKYVIGVLIGVPVFILALILISNMSFKDAFYRGMVLLTVASPCALVASFTPAVLSAIGNAAKNGILFKNGYAIESLREITLIATDKTGTLTEGKFEVVEFDLSDELVREVVYIESNSNHPIAESIVEHFNNVDILTVDKSEIEEIAGHGLKKGNISIGNKKLFSGFIDPKNYLEIPDNRGSISLIAKDREIVGYIILKDKIRESSKNAIESFKNSSVRVEMLTGDNKVVASQVAEQLGLDGFRAECLPATKLEYINENKSNNKILMIGDGINDSPALAASDIGVAMGAGTSIAMESADVVIVKNDLNKLFYSYQLSNKLSQISKQNVVFSITVILSLIIANVIGILDLPTGVVFHESSTILVILNGLRLLYYKEK